MILDVITEGIQEDTPWAMLFADDFVLCDESRERMEERLALGIQVATIRCHCRSCSTNYLNKVGECNSVCDQSAGSF